MGGFFSIAGKLRSTSVFKIILLLFIFCITVNGVSVAQNLLRPNIEGPAGLQVNSFTGSLFYQRTDMYIPGRGLSLNITFSYNSADRRSDYGYGYGWTISYNEFYKDSAGGLVFYRAGGRKDFYTRNGSSFTAPKGIFDVLTGAAGSYVLTAKDGTKYSFESDTHKKLSRITDRNGNELKLAYTVNNLSSVTDASGRSIIFNRDGNGHLREIRSEAASPMHFIKYGYDNAYNLTSVTDAKDQVISYAYGADWVMNSMIDGEKNEIKITYTSNSAVHEIISCLAIKTIAYNSGNGTVAVADQTNGRTFVTTYYFDLQGRLASRVGNCCGYSNSFDYDADNNISRIVDANGHNYFYGYDAKGNLTSETDPYNKTVYYTYEAKFNQVTSIRDKRGNVTSFEYDAKGNLLKKNYPLSITQEFKYDDKGNLVKFIDGRKNVVDYEPDEYGYLKSKKDSAGTTLYDYDAWGNMVYMRDANEHETIYIFNILNQLETVRDARQRETKYFYDHNGNLEKLIDAKDHATDYRYDAYDNLIYTEDALHNMTSFTYDGMGSLLSSIDANGHTTIYAYDNFNRLLNSTNALGETTRYSYDGNGNRTSVAYPNGNTVFVTYDALNRVETVTDQLGPLASYSYDANSNKLTQSNGIGNTTTYRYDALNRIEYEYDPIGNANHYEYDENNNLVKQTNRNGNPTYYYYDPVNRPDYTIDALNNKISYGYDKGGNLTSVTDPRNNTTKYIYDELNRKTDEIFADLTTTHFEYDNVGNLVSRKDNNGKVTQYRYDDIDRLTDRYYPNSTESFTYDPEGKMKSAVNGNATIKFDYDKADRIISEILNDKKTLYAYDISGRTKTITYPNGRVVQRQMDGRNHLVDIKDGSDVVAEFTFNTAGQNTFRKFKNGTTNIYNYTNRGQINDQGFAPAHFNDVGHSYDKEGNPLSSAFKNTGLTGEKYGYDLINRLTSFSKNTNDQFKYDGVGNRESASINGINYTYDVNSMNAYTSILFEGNTITPVYDANGNTTYDGTNNYSFDIENRITAVNAGATASYKYDALGRRIQKVTGTETINYYFDGLQIIEERNQDDSTIASYIWGTWLDDIVSMNRGANSYYYNTNLIGSVVSITDSSGAITERYEYDPFGKQTIYDANNTRIVTSSIGNTYSFTGRQIDIETGLYFYRARYYDATIGRFLQRDPLNYEEGVNLYSYVKNSPVALIDPLGSISTEYIDWNNEEQLDQIQSDLDYIGLAPGAGEPADLTNAYISYERGHYGYAFLSGVSAIPLAGWCATGIKLGIKRLKAAKAANFTQNAVDDLVVSLRKKYGGNVTVMKDGQPIFRVHQPGSHENVGSTITNFSQHTNHQGFSFPKADRKVSSFDQKSFDILNQAINGKGGYSIRTKGGR